MYCKRYELAIQQLTKNVRSRTDPTRTALEGLEFIITSMSTGC